jgi:hypothetical protein
MILSKIKFITITSFRILKNKKKIKKKNIYGKFQCISLINSSFDDALFDFGLLTMGTIVG